MFMHKEHAQICSCLILLISVVQGQTQFHGPINSNDSIFNVPPTLSIQQPNQLSRNVVPPPPNLSAAPIFSQTIISNEAARESSKRLSQGAYTFSMDLFSRISDVASKARSDVMISPFAVWSLLLLLLEGAEGSTFYELQTGLHINQDLPSVRKAFRDVQNFLKLKTGAIEVASMQAIFIDKNRPATNQFENNVRRDYGAEIFGVDYQNPIEATVQMNSIIKDATRGLIPYSILPQDLENADMLLMSALFFKGQWKLPFNSSLTRVEPFYDEDGNNIGNVEMMSQEAEFRYVNVNELQAHVLELPYGTQNRLTMLIAMPKKGVSTSSLVHNMKKISPKQIFDKLDSVNTDDGDYSVEVLMPKFSTQSDLALDGILQEMGFVEMFNSYANFSKISSSVFVQTILHSTKIIVNEEGTVAGAVATAVLANKAIPAKFYLNRPFVYQIVEKTTNAVLFAGVVMNPNKYKY